MRFPTGASRQSRTVKRALALFKADEELGDREIADVRLINAATVARARNRYVEEGLEAASNDRPRPGRERKLDGQQEAHPVSSTGQALIAFARSAAPRRTRALDAPVAGRPGGGVGVLPRAAPWRRCASYSKK